MSIRFKLTLWAIGVILVVNAIFSLASVVYLEKAWTTEIEKRVLSDLSSAQAAYDQRIDRLTLFLRAAALDHFLDSTLPANVKQSESAAEQSDNLQKHLREIFKTDSVDFLVFLDASGKVLARPRHPESVGDSLEANPLVAEVLKTKAPVSGTLILSHDDLAKEGKDLEARATVKIIPTEGAKPSPEKEQTSGMIIAAAVPVQNARGEPVGILYGGELLNGRNAFVDALKKQVFLKETYEGKDIGTVTIFQNDLRIATNVMQNDGTRAVGTRMSEAVAQKVLTEGELWKNPAFVVNDWYHTAYKPLRGLHDEILGALYVGLLKAPFDSHQNVITAVFLSMVTVTTLATLTLIYFVTKLVLRPVGRIVDMAQRVADGDLSARVAIRPPGEFGQLCRAIDAMADAVLQREEKIKQATRQQITRSEKLASIGRLAAGVAHEINNPLTGVLTFAHLLREKSNMDDQDKEDLELIIRETTRAAEIVRGLLDFARERPSLTQRLDMNEAVRRTVQLIRNQKLFDGIIIKEELAAELPDVDGDLNRLQQVLLNLTLNSCEAMPEGGNITIRTFAKNGEIRVAVADTGHGIKKELLEKIFEPFFSTKPVGQGTGLGLAVSYGIIEQHGGVIEVDSEEGKGTTFTIVLPKAPPEQIVN